jgi:type VI secretion system VasD/TssJ family lipoprotein
MALKIFPALGIIVTLLVACASQPLPAPEWIYEKDAIEVYLRADPRLNLDEGVPHTLLVCLYQLKDPNAFNQLLDDPDGIYTLLECGLFDPSAATVKQIIVRPGRDMNLKLDRAAGAKYVAVAAGYYILEKERMARLYKIPVIVEKKGFFRWTKLSRPGLLKIEIDLGPSQIK